MSGKCYSCTSSFGVFRREIGCKNCGFSFCKDCLSKKIEVPKHRKEVHRVCNKCYALLSGKAKPESNAKYSPPEAYKKRLAALESKADSSSTSRVTSGGKQRGHKGLSKEDIAIAERLEKLKEDRAKACGPVPSQEQMEQRLAKLKEDKNAPPVPSHEEMQARLAKLKGQDPAEANKPHMFQQERRSEQQQIDDLLNEICEEVEIDSHFPSAADEVQSRLENLKAGPTTSVDDTVGPNGATSRNTYSQNLPLCDEKTKTASGEDVDISEMNDLMSKTASELDAEAAKAVAGLKQDKELWNRLQKIKKTDKRDDGGDEGTAALQDACCAADTDEADEGNEEEQEKAVIEKILAEQKLDEKLDESELMESAVKRLPVPPGEVVGGLSSRLDEKDSEHSDGLPWCCICNADATLRCRGCDDDLYCNRCYREGHDSYDMDDHQTSPFKTQP